MARIARSPICVVIAAFLTAVSAAFAEPGIAPQGDSTAELTKVVLPEKKLRGYGRLSAQWSELNLAGGKGSLTKITCESPEKALLVQAKYLSDLGLLPGVDTETLAAGKRSLAVRHAPGGASIARGAPRTIRT